MLVGETGFLAAGWYRLFGILLQTGRIFSSDTSLFICNLSSHWFLKKKKNFPTLRAIPRCSLVALLKIMKHKKYFRLLAVPGERIWYSFYDLMASDYHPKGMRIFPQINKFPSHELLSHPLVAFSSFPWNSCRRLHTMSVTGVYDKSWWMWLLTNCCHSCFTRWNIHLQVNHLIFGGTAAE